MYAILLASVNAASQIFIRLINLSLEVCVSTCHTQADIVQAGDELQLTK